jgi:hypothetical protein
MAAPSEPADFERYLDAPFEAALFSNVASLWGLQTEEAGGEFELIRDDGGRWTVSCSYVNDPDRVPEIQVRADLQPKAPPAAPMRLLLSAAKLEPLGGTFATDSATYAVTGHSFPSAHRAVTHWIELRAGDAPIAAGPTRFSFTRSVRYHPDSSVEQRQAVAPALLAFYTCGDPRYWDRDRNPSPPTYRP